MEMVLYEDYNAAVDFFTKAIECDPQYAEAYYNIGCIHQFRGDTKQAENYFNKAKQLGFEENT